MSVTRINPADLNTYLGVSNVVVAGDYVFIAGQCGGDAAGQPANGIEAQLARLYDNLEIACQAAGGSIRDIVRTVTYIIDLSYFPAVQKTRQERYGEHPPANSTIVVSALAQPEWLVEIEAIAYLKAPGSASN